MASASSVRRPSASCRIKAGAIRSGALEPFTPEISNLMRGGARARVNRQQRERAQPPFDRGEDRSERVGAVDHHEPAAGLEQRERGAIQACERRPAVRRRQDMGQRPPLRSGRREPFPLRRTAGW